MIFLIMPENLGRITFAGKIICQEQAAVLPQISQRESKPKR
jgi:hypothetical protein